MCGINGVTRDDIVAIGRMNDAIRHRGPDDEGRFCDGTVSLGHVRLAVIDISERGHQPMGVRGTETLHRDGTMDDADVVIVLNGEVYDFRELRERIGGEFHSDSDTEVVLRAYERWGDGCFEHLNGMWAMAIYDRRDGRVLLSRDRLGVKPLYYSIVDGELAFSSELKGLMVLRDHGEGDIDADALELYLSMGFIPSPMSVLRDVRKLPAGHCLEFDLGTGTARTWRHWSLPPYSPSGDRRSNVAEARALLEDATRLRMAADVPVGAFLSGGLDSSSVVGTVCRESKERLKTFSIGFDGEGDETPYIDMVNAMHDIRNHHRTFGREDFEASLDEYAEAFDEPFWDDAAFPTLALCADARRDVTVALSGDGGDEVFTGYPMHLRAQQLARFRRVPRVARRMIARLPANEASDGALSRLVRASRISLAPQEDWVWMCRRDEYLPERCVEWTRGAMRDSLALADGDVVEAHRIFDLMHFTLADNYLTKVDRASMLHSLEVRSPYLDYRFAELAQRVPTSQKMDGGLKGMMRLVIDGLVPDGVRDREKQGFSPPVRRWIASSEYDAEVESALTTLERLLPGVRLRLPLDGRNAAAYRTRLVLFDRWYGRWVRGTPRRSA